MNCSGDLQYFRENSSQCIVNAGCCCPEYHFCPRLHLSNALLNCKLPFHHPSNPPLLNNLNLSSPLLPPRIAHANADMLTNGRKLAKGQWSSVSKVWALERE